MTDCPLCNRAVDGLFCRFCAPPKRPPFDFASLKAKCKPRDKPPRHDPEAELERHAIADEGW